MNTVRSRLERGEVSELVLVVFVALVLIIGLVVDGGAKMTAASEASSIAQQAARVGGQPLDSLPADGETAHLDAGSAAAAAQDYLDQAGVAGSVRIVNSSTLEVTVTSTEDTTFLGLIGINTVSATRTARVDLIHGQAEVIP
ncbi:pilus assembly protein TadG-related protein [Brachybacterium sp. sponge]|uniref:pilus assembly protein TadG-related protein n=1 Tax=Brachybacterium sp. sponge TaxID=1775432 RepID=UPI0007A4332A|nr:pilus assembly protein TadG-related protein [Brachybacterium sp. sponge]